MKKNRKKAFNVIIICLIVFAAIEIPTGYFKAKIFLLSAPENSLTLWFSVYPADYEVFCVDGTSSFLLDISLSDSENNPVPYAWIHVELNHFTGTIEPKVPVTDRNGQAVIRIRPDTVPVPATEDKAQVHHWDVSVTLHTKKGTPAQWNGILTVPPVLLIHGFQDRSESLVPMKNYLEDRGFLVFLMDYETEGEIEGMVDTLESALKIIKEDLKSKKILANRTDIVAHSLGGLVARYYSTRRAYILSRNIRKLIFINVPHHGTPWADTGSELLGSPVLKKLHPTSELFTLTFPGMINKGLNHQIQTANIALDNDEVIPLPGTTLSSWNIDTKIYRIGSKPLDLHSLIEAPLSGSTRHRQTLFYIPIFEEIAGYLKNDLPYPEKNN